MTSFPALILAKSDSKRLPGKNLLNFDGRPMFVVNLEKCLRLFPAVYVSSDSQEILDIATLYGAIPILRGPELCGDTPNIPVYQHALKQMGNVDGIIAIQANSPTISTSIISLVQEIMEMRVGEVMTCFPNRSLYGSIWGIHTGKLLNYGDVYFPKPQVLVVDRSIDIHTEEDYQRALAWQQSTRA